MRKIGTSIWWNYLEEEASYVSETPVASTSRTCLTVLAPLKYTQVHTHTHVYKGACTPQTHTHTLTHTHLQHAPVAASRTRAERSGLPTP